MGSTLPLAASLQAAAEAVDGSWCAPDGRRMVVEGTRLLTPGGQIAQGRYSERAFAVVIPEGEWLAGKTLWLERTSPDSLRVSVESENQQGPPPHDRWVLCPYVS